MSQIKNILFISYDGLTDPLGQSQVIPYLSNLCQYGYTFTILSCDKPDAYARNKTYVEQLIAGFPINWVSVPYHKKPPVLSTFFDYLALKQAAEKLHQAKRFDMVHTRSGIATLVAVYLKKKYAIKFVHDVRGFWADERVDGGMWRLGNPVYKMIYRFFKQHELDCLAKADHVVCLTEAGKKEMHQWKAVPNQPVPIEVIPCSVDLDLFDPATFNVDLKNKFAQQFNIQEEDMIISYLGSLGGWYLTDEMIRFCKQLADCFPSAKFLFITPNSKSSVEVAASKFGLSSDKLIVAQAQRHEVPVLLSFSAYSIFFIKPCYSKIASSPTKHGEIMAMGIPVITNAGVGDVERIVNKYQSGFVLASFTDAAYRKVLDKMNNASFDKLLIRQGAYQQYALTEAVNKYLNVYRTVLPA